jgi:hypothetical protein
MLHISRSGCTHISIIGAIFGNFAKDGILEDGFTSARVVSLTVGAGGRNIQVDLHQFDRVLGVLRGCHGDINEENLWRSVGKVRGDMAEYTLLIITIISSITGHGINAIAGLWEAIGYGNIWIDCGRYPAYLYRWVPYRRYRVWIGK